LARIEVPQPDIESLLALAARQEIRHFFHQIGFRYVTVDLDGFRSGSLNAVLPVESVMSRK
jgi:uncharacterized protein